MYQALYRKWRPRSFDQVAGQEHITDTLRRQIETGRTSHAYLFTGTRGTGKTTCAKILAKALNCEHPEGGNPCNKCPACLGIDAGSVTDVEELDAASNNGVDNVRALRDEAIYTPASVKKRVYIIDEVHMLSTSAFNALLKIMEEPPEHLVFILATTELRKVPATILSRCQRFSFRRLPPNVVRERLKFVASQEGLSLTEEAASLLGHLADGSMRDGLSLLDQCVGAGKAIDVPLVESCVGLAGAQRTGELFKAVSENRPGDAIALLDGLYSEGRDVGSVLGELCVLMRDVLMLRIAPKNGDSLTSGTFDPKTLEALGRDTPDAKLLSWISAIQRSIFEMGRGADRRMLAELCLLTLCDGRLAGAPAVMAPAASAAPRAAEAPAQPKPAPQAPAPDIPAAAPAPEIPAESKSAVPAEAPAAEQAAPTVSEAGWPEILAALKGHMDMMPYVFLSQSEGAVNGGALTVYARDPAAKGILDTSPVRESIEKAASGILGRDVTVAVELRAPTAPPPAEDKLDRLSKFENIVKFK